MKTLTVKCSELERLLGIKGKLVYIAKKSGKNHIVIEYKETFDESDRYE